MSSLLDGFSKLEVIGTGAGSTIFRGVSNEDGQVYAIKVVKWTQPGDERFIKQAMNEFKIASVLEHPNLIRMHDARRQRKFFKTVEYGIVMDYFAGRMLSERSGFSMVDTVAIFLQVAEALAYMHRIGYVHTDIKPENILVDDQANVRVIDFGVACKRNATKDRVQGTPEFMAPEQTTKKPLDERTDIYNLGATMYKVLTGKIVPENVSLSVPVGSNGESMLLAKSGVRHHNSAVPERLAYMIEKCSRRSRSKRYQRMREVVDGLYAVLRETAPPDYRFLRELPV